MATTLQDIADAVGVSKVTVSKVLRGKVKGSWPKSAQRVQQIREVAERMGYQVDWRAKALQSGRTQMVGLLSTTRPETDTHDPALVSGLTDTLGAAGYHVAFYRIRDNAEHSGFADARFDGVIIDYHIEPEEIALIQRAELPAVIINAPSAKGIASVMPNHENIGRMAARHLLELGHRCIGFLQSADGEKRIWPQHMYRAWRRGILAEMKTAGCGDGYTDIIPPDEIQTIGPKAFAPNLKKLAADPERPTAIIGKNPDKTFDLVINQLSGTGLKIPRDLSVMSITDQPELAWVTPAITAIDLNFAGIARQAAVELLRQIEPDSGVIDQLPDTGTTQPVLNIRGSTSAPRTSSRRSAV
ncbi:MAG: LacI family DNA-binding transcriptional regulator [Planctomycetota bacterium]